METRDYAALSIPERNISEKYERMSNIERYLHLLYQAQSVGHDVHKEIDEALKEYKRVAGL